MKRALEDEKAKAFLEEFELLCRKHDLIFGHEDSQGAFIVESFHEYNLDWINQAYLE